MLIRKCWWLPTTHLRPHILTICGTICGSNFFLGKNTDPQKLIWMDTQGSLSHITAIFKFGHVSGPRAKKWPKVNHGLEIVYYFTCMWHFSCRWYGPPEIDLNGYPRICNPYCRDIFSVIHVITENVVFSLTVNMLYYVRLTCYKSFRK